MVVANNRQCGSYHMSHRDFAKNFTIPKTGQGTSNCEHVVSEEGSCVRKRTRTPKLHDLHFMILRLAVEGSAHMRTQFDRAHTSDDRERIVNDWRLHSQNVKMKQYIPGPSNVVPFWVCYDFWLGYSFQSPKRNYIGRPRHDLLRVCGACLALGFDAFSCESQVCY